MKTKRELYEILAAHSGVSVRKIEKDADRDYWLFGPRGKEYGLIDEVLFKTWEVMAQNKNNNNHRGRNGRRQLLVLRCQARGCGDHVPGHGRCQYLQQMYRERL